MLDIDRIEGCSVLAPGGRRDQGRDEGALHGSDG